jgi:histidine triad (HIT) family protein
MLNEEEAEEIRKQLLEQIGQLPKDQADKAEAFIKSASAEQLEAFVARMQGPQGGECIFCQIIDGKLETVKIYEDADILCVLDLYPATPGHVLVMPKKHFQFINEIDDTLLKKMALFVKTLEPILVASAKSKGVSIYIAQGELAGQRVPHFCINMIPRYTDDKLSFDWPKQKAEKEKLEEIASVLREKASKEVKSKIEVEVKKETEKKKAEEESEAEKIMKHVKRRMP